MCMGVVYMGGVYMGAVYMGVVYMGVVRGAGHKTTAEGGGCWACVRACGAPHLDGTSPLIHMHMHVDLCCGSSP